MQMPSSQQVGAYRNALVANSEAVVAVGGGAGTLSEIAFAWQFNRLILAVGGEGQSTGRRATPTTAVNPNRRLFWVADE